MEQVMNTIMARAIVTLIFTVPMTAAMALTASAPRQY
jgi:hypothetical protein